MATTHAFESEAQQSKNEGNKLFIAEQYLPAIDAYTRAINIITTQKVEETVEENPEEEKCKIEEVTDEEAAAITNKVEGLNMNDNSNTNNNNSSDTPNEPFTDTPAQVTAEPILPKTPQQELEEFVASVPADLRNLLSICYANRAGKAHTRTRAQTRNTHKAPSTPHLQHTNKYHTRTTNKYVHHYHPPHHEYTKLHPNNALFFASLLSCS